MPEEEKDAPREYILKELMWAYRHLAAANVIERDSLSRCREDWPEHAEAMGELERLTGFTLSALFATERAIEFTSARDIEDADKEIRQEKPTESLPPGFVTAPPA